MNDFQEQAKNWLRNVVKQNPDDIKAGVDKAGDLIDKQTGGKYADKVDTVQQKVGGLVDSQSSDGTSAEQASEAGATGVASPDGGGARRRPRSSGETLPTRRRSRRARPAQVQKARAPAAPPPGRPAQALPRPVSSRRSSLRVNCPARVRSARRPPGIRADLPEPGPTRKLQDDRRQTPVRPTPTGRPEVESRLEQPVME